MSDNRKILKNFSYLTTIQLMSMVMPFLYYPYLIRVLGAEIYGKFVYVQILVAYITIAIDFGFNLYGTKKVAENSGSTLNEIVSCIFSVKLFIFILLFPFYYLLSAFFVSDLELHSLIIVMYLFSLGDVLFCQWYFQGKEKNHISAIIMFLTKLLNLIAIFIFIKSKQDLDILVYISIATSVFSGVSAIFALIFLEKIKVRWFGLELFLNTIKGAYPFFLSRLTSVIIIRTNGLLIAEFLGMHALALYDLALKFMNLLLLPIQMLNQALYPNIAKSKKFKLVFRVTTGLFILTIFCYFISLYLYEPLITMFAGPDMAESSKIWRYIALIIPISAISYFLGNCFLIIDGHGKIFNTSIYVGFLAYSSYLLFTYINGFFSIETLSFSLVINSLFIGSFRLFFTIRLRHN